MAPELSFSRIETDVPANTFKRALKAGRIQIGLWCALASNVAVEIVAGAGFDWLLLDSEHAPNELPMIYSQLQASVGGTAHPIVRPPSNDGVALKRLLDAGVQTFLVPCVETVEDAQRAVSATRYPPRGVRGYASATRASRFGRVKNYHTACEQELCVLVQVETQLGLDNIEAISQAEGVDGVFIGPGDLSASLGYLGMPGHPVVQRTIEAAIERIKSSGNVPGILASDEKAARHFIELGCLFTAVGSDSSLLARGSEQLLGKFKAADPPA